MSANTAMQCATVRVLMVQQRLDSVGISRVKLCICVAGCLSATSAGVRIQEIYIGLLFFDIHRAASYTVVLY